MRPQVLADEEDTLRLWGAARMSKYVAEHNVVPLLEPRRIVNRYLEHYFRGFSLARRRCAFFFCSVFIVLT